MGEFILCREQTALHPFFHETLSVHLYTIEELCYYMETNLFLLDKNFIGEPLFAWLKEELGLVGLSGRLRQIYQKSRDVYVCVEMIFQESGYYSGAELRELSALLERMRGKTEMECRKMRADRLLAAKKYRQAVYTYLELLQPEHTARMTEELQGNLMHNLGVAYARLFLFKEASEMFSEAYRKRKSEVSRRGYLAAQNFLSDTVPVKEQEMEIHFSQMQEALSKFTEAKELPKYCRERKEASEAAAAFDWRQRQTELTERWRLEFQEML